MGRQSTRAGAADGERQSPLASTAGRVARTAVLVAALPMLSLVVGCADAAARPDRLTAGAAAADPSVSTVPTSSAATPSASTPSTPTSSAADPSASTAPTSSVVERSASMAPTPRDSDAGLAGSAMRLEDLGRADELLGIVSVDSAHSRLVVHRVTGASSPLYPRAVNGFPVVFADAVLTRRQTDETMQVLYYDNRAYFAAHHVHVQAVESDGAGPVTVHLEQVSASGAALVGRVAPYGPRSVNVAGPIVIRAAGGSVTKPGGSQR